MYTHSIQKLICKVFRAKKALNNKLSNRNENFPSAFFKRKNLQINFYVCTTRLDDKKKVIEAHTVEAAPQGPAKP